MSDVKKTYSHYYKPIPPGVEYVDVYRVLELFDVSNPAIQHAVKKLLVAGGRGHKDLEKDVREAIVSLTRWVEMREEEKKGLSDIENESLKFETLKRLGKISNEFDVPKSKITLD
jgi:hypothetical protein